MEKLLGNYMSFLWILIGVIISLLKVISAQWVGLNVNYCDDYTCGEQGEAGFGPDCGSFCYQYSSFSSVVLWKADWIDDDITCNVYSDNYCNDYISSIDLGYESPGIPNYCTCLNNPNGWGNSIKCWYDC
jgi:hypothetical protein